MKLTEWAVIPGWSLCASPAPTVVTIDQSINKLISKIMDAFSMLDTVVCAFCPESATGPLQEYRDSHIPREALGVLCCFHPCLPGEERVLEKALNGLQSILIKHIFFESKSRT